MISRNVIAAAMALVMAFGAIPAVVGAEEEPALPVPIETGPANVGVYFADNMVYTPQWRVGNLVRIEMMVVDMSDGVGGVLQPKQIPAADINMYDQADLLADPTLISNTRMVSVDYIKVDIVDSVGATAWSAELQWDPVTLEPIKTSDVFGREINKAGHLIYGGQWDTSSADLGVYTVRVTLGTSYTISYAMGTNTTDEVYIYDQLADDVTDDVYVLYDLGIGGVTEGTAWLDLGDLLARGGGGGNSGEGHHGGGDGGNGSGGHKGR